MALDLNAFDDPRDILGWFELSSSTFVWAHARREEIEARRTKMEGELFFDVLMLVGGIKDPQNYFPPSDLMSLKKLLDAVESASFDTMKKDCLIYYLLKWNDDGREEKFADEKCISPHYMALADAYWYLDSGLELATAIALLSDARIVRENASKILQTLSLSPNSSHLILKYVRTCRPALRDPIDLERYILALAEHDFHEALAFQRTLGEGEGARVALIQKLLEWAVTPKPKISPLTQLISVPLSPFEERAVHRFATDPSSFPPTAASLLCDLLCVRLIQQSRFVDAVKFDRQYCSNSASPVKSPWMTERKKFIQDIIAIIPAAERRLLEFELDKIRSGFAPEASFSSSSRVHLDGDLSASWEEIPSMSKSNTPAQKLPSRDRPASISKPGPPGIRHSVFGTPRTPLPNGIPIQSLFTPGASTSSANNLSMGSRLAAARMSTPVSNALPRQSLQSSTPVDRPTPSIFGAHTAIDNSTSRPAARKSNAFTAQNAFFTPPVQPQLLNGTSDLPRRESPPTPSRVSVEPALSEAQEDMREASEDNQEFSGFTAEESEAVQSDGEQLGFSLFGTSANNSASKPNPSSPKARIAQKNGKEQQLPPGAFLHDIGNDSTLSDLPDSFRSEDNSRRKASVPLSASNKSAGAKKRPTRKRAMSSEDELKLSMPGSLFAGEDEEDEDELAPLPHVTKKAAGPRKSTRRRSSRTSDTDSVDGDVDGERPVRRSSRLSAASSPTSDKPPARPRKKTKTSTTASSATTRSTAKRR